MKKMGLLVVVASLSLSLAAFAAETSASNQGKAPTGPTEVAKGKVRGVGRVDPATQQKMLTEQLATFQKEHQAALGELQAIKTLAVKEKATETATALDKLIAKHEQAFQKRVEPLQQRLKKLEAVSKQGADAAPGATDKAAKKGMRKSKANN